MYIKCGTISVNSPASAHNSWIILSQASLNSGILIYRGSIYYGVWMCTPENDKGTVPKCVEKCERSHLQDWSKCERSHFNQIPSDEHTHGGSSEGVGIGHKCCWSVIKVFTNTYMYFGMAERHQLILWYNANYSNSHSFWMAAEVWGIGGIQHEASSHFDCDVIAGAWTTWRRLQTM